MGILGKLFPPATAAAIDLCYLRSAISFRLDTLKALLALLIC